MKRLKLSPRVERLLALEPRERRRVIKQLTRTERAQLYYHWEFWGRPAQVWRPGPSGGRGTTGVRENGSGQQPRCEDRRDKQQPEPMSYIHCAPPLVLNIP